MVISDDLAKLLYWGCVIWPIAGIIGILTCYGANAKFRCHVLVSLVTVLLTVFSSFVKEDFWVPPIWNNDKLTFFLRIMIASGAALVTMLARYWVPVQLQIKKDYRFLFNLVICQLIVAVSLLIVAINNFFIAMILLFSLVFLLMAGCLVNGGEERIKAGWDYFRYLFFFMVLSLMGVFLLNVATFQPNPILEKFGGFLVSLGIILCTGIFPVCIPFLKLVTRLPTLLGGLGLFIIPLSFFSLFLRLHQIPNYHVPDLFMNILILSSLFFLIIKERAKGDFFLLLISPFFMSLIFLMSIFIPDPEVIYCICLMMVTWIVFASLGYILWKSQGEALYKNWLILALSGFPPFGMFCIASIFMPYLVIHAPVLGYGVLGLLFVRGYFLLHREPFVLFSPMVWSRNGYILMSIFFVQLFLFPVLTRQWVSQILVQFIQ